MKYLFQFLIILAISFIGEMLNHFIPLPIPASIYGIILLFVLLELKIVKVRHIKEVSTFLIAVMPIMFLPPAVGLIESWDTIAPSLPSYAAITIISTFTVMAAAGATTQFIIRRKKTKKEQ